MVFNRLSTMEQHIENLLRCGPRMIYTYELVEKTSVGDQITLVIRIGIPHYVAQVHEEYMEWVANVLPLYDGRGKTDFLGHEYLGDLCFVTLRYTGIKTR